MLEEGRNNCLFYWAFLEQSQAKTLNHWTILLLL
jgi:hypothetical protein